MTSGQHELLAPLNPKPRPELIAERLRAAIFAGVLQPGQQLGETALAQSFGVSRNPLREAMARLVAEGLLTSIPHRGIFVVQLSAGDIEDIYEVRRVIEQAAALRLINSGSSTVTQRLRAACHEMADAVASHQWEKFSEADYRFHRALVADSESPRLMRSAEILLIETRICLRRLEDKYPRPMAAVKEHSDIADAIDQADVARARQLIDKHMTDAVIMLTNQSPA